MPMLKEALSGLLSNEEISFLSSSFDVIGDIAIIKIPDVLHSREGTIANAILSRMKNVRTILNQTSNVEGEFRVRKVQFIAGEEKFETIYKESGCLFKVDVSSVYFSPRLSTERERIADLVKSGERIFNMFAGVGTFSVVVAKKKICTVDSVDKNPRAIELAKETLGLNRKLKGKVNPILADALDYSADNLSSFDRVLMPLPEKSFDFLKSAFSCLKKGGMVHYYTHVSQEEFLDKTWIEDHLASAKIPRKFEVMKWKRVREVGPRYIQAVADILSTD
jgi:tRNA (guanine37-N1)-methyltransferase